jgi:aryl-alcohol dehydrogenase-like predicted oxidoreductase
MRASAEGTERYVERRPEFRRAAFCRTLFDLEVFSLGIGTCLGDTGDAAGESGIDIFDTAIDYRHRRSGRSLGAVPDSLRPEDVVAGIPSMAPYFLEDRIERSRANLGVDSIDVFYLHNPETQLGFLTPAEFETNIRRVFAHLERFAGQGRIRWYGAATWDGFRKKGAHGLPRMVALAIEEGRPERHFRFIQLPFNLGLVEAVVERPDNVLTAAASAALSQTRALDRMPAGIAGELPGLAANAQRAIQFTRSTPGIPVALAGMGRRARAVENLGVAAAPPVGREAYRRRYQ